MHNIKKIPNMYPFTKIFWLSLSILTSVHHNVYLELFVNNHRQTPLSQLADAAILAKFLNIEQEGLPPFCDITSRTKH
jgi:hypothetical protein